MPESMKAAVFYGAKNVRVESVSVPTPSEGELLLEVVAAGICGTDAHEFNSGPHMFPGAQPHPFSGHSGPMTIGHEFAGRVIEAPGSGSSFQVGELVVCGAGVWCGDCIQCKRGRTNLCERYWTVGLQRDGALAEYVRVPAETCFSADSVGLSEDLAGLTQPTAIAVHAASRGRVCPEDEVIILGAGGIGAFLVKVVSSIAAKIAVVDLSDERLGIARKNGAQFTQALTETFDISDLKSQWGIRPTVVFEVSGTEKGLEAAREWLEPGGRLVMVGLQGKPGKIDYRLLSLTEVEAIGTNAHVAREDFPRALELLAASNGAWSAIAPVMLPLSEIVTGGLEPLVSGSSEQIKTLFDPRITERRPSKM